MAAFCVTIDRAVPLASRNHFIKGEKLQGPCALNRRAADMLKEFQIQQTYIPRIPDPCPVDLWQPPPTHIYKLNFDGAVLSDNLSSGFGAIIRNDRARRGENLRPSQGNLRSRHRRCRCALGLGAGWGLLLEFEAGCALLLEFEADAPSCFTI
ncbi:hypothetical protein SO802_022722 [Lithocarpus litseifolius]|uniref:RNase H type-1 domain-containing protein n=1 Tax=Lithocarpus litseifolius TaxID=425828 RepID=A0AAW2C7S4_9ROSI